MTKARKILAAVIAAVTVISPTVMSVGAVSVDPGILADSTPNVGGTWSGKLITDESGAVGFQIESISGCPKLTKDDTLVFPSTYLGIPVVKIGSDDNNRSSFGAASNVGKIVIPEGVEVLGDYVFADFYNIESIEFPDSLKKIGADAFEHCRSLESVVLPEKVTEIEDYTFASCTSLKSVEFSENITSIGNLAFEGCTSLENVVFPENITQIGDAAFRGCESLTSITIPSSVEKVYSEAFAESGVQKVEINADTTDWGTTDYWSIFESCDNLEEIILSENVSLIPAYMFSGCDSLRSVVIPGTVKVIGDSAFANCSNLRNVEFEDGLEKIGERAFYCCQLGLAYDDAGLRVYGDLVLPDTLKTIGGYAFCLSYYKSVTFPDGIQKIGDFAFTDCFSLKTINNLTYSNDKKEDFFIGRGIFNDTNYYTSWRSSNENVLYMGDILLDINVRTQKEDVTVREGTKVMFKRWYGDFPIGYSGTITIPVSLENCRSLRQAFKPESSWELGLKKERFEKATLVYMGSEKRFIETFSEDGYKAVKSVFKEVIFAGYDEGDVNGDGRVNAKDSNMLKRAVTGNLELTDVQISAGDLNGDGSVNTKDIYLLKKFFLNK